MFERLIVATDFSPEAYAVANCLGGLMEFGAKECLLMQCLSVQDVASVALSYSTTVVEGNLKSQREILEKQGLQVKTLVIPGLPKREVCRVAEKQDYSMIVVGAGKHNLTGEVLFGGLAYDIVHHCSKPVLVIRLISALKEGVACVESKGCNFNQHILFPTDFSETADLAFDQLKKMVATGTRKVTLVHVQDQTRLDPHLLHRLDDFNQIDKDRLETMKNELLAITANLEVDIELVYGKPSVEILRQVNGTDVQLVIMGSQGRGYVKELFLGSVSHEIVRHSDASVLLIPAKREPEPSDTI